MWNKTTSTSPISLEVCLYGL